MLSRPMRARGLKLTLANRGGANATVAPHAGAWIETNDGNECGTMGNVAPHAGAWIET